MASPATKKSPAAPAIHVPSKASFVTVASKLPFAVILQICEARTNRTSGQHGYVDEVVHHKVGQAYEIKGTAYPSGQAPKGFPRAPNMIEDQSGGYALTPNVPADFWDAWLEQNKGTEMVVNGLLKAQPDLDSLAADAAEHASVDSGLGPLNPEADRDGRPLDRRSPRPMNASVSAVRSEARP